MFTSRRIFSELCSLLPHRTLSFLEDSSTCAFHLHLHLVAVILADKIFPSARSMPVSDYL
eukprot:scaffold225243_cov32-Tisochrysis_lutea.AAC.4